MLLKRNKSLFTFLVLLFLSPVLSYSFDLQTLLRDDRRPDILNLDKQLKAAKDALPLSSYSVDQDILPVIEELLVGVLNKSEKNGVVFLGRDCDPVFDALQVVLKKHPNRVSLSKKFFLLNLSRPLAQQSTPDQLKAFLEANGIDVNGLLNGKKSYLFFDTGRRGSIFVALFSKLAATLAMDKRKKALSNLLKNAKVKLVVSEGTDTSKETLKELEKYPHDLTPENIKSFLNSYLYFPVLFSTDKQWTQAHLPSSSQDRYRWVVSHIERSPKWNDRASSLSTDGKSVSQTSAHPRDTLDRSSYIAYQLTLIDYFRKSVTKINNALKALIPKKNLPPKQKVTSAKKAVVPTPQTDSKIHKANISLFGKTLQPGEFLLIDGIKYEIVQYVDTGKRGAVYKVKLDGNYFAFKIAKKREEKTIKSVKTDVSRAKQYEKHGINHAKVLASGNGFVLKEWIEGTRGDEWLLEWQRNGAPLNSDAVIKLRQFLKDLALKGVYIGDLNSKNWIWDGQNWTILESGSIRIKSSNETFSRYRKNMSRRWSKVGPDCKVLFRNLKDQ